VLIYNHGMSLKTSPSQNNLRVILVLVCVLLLLGGYYIIHKPVNPELASALGLGFWRVLTAIFIVSLAGAIGRFIGLKLEDCLCSTVVIQAGFGLGILSVYILIAGSTFGVNRFTLMAVPLIVAALLYKQLIAWIAQLAMSISGIWRETGRFEKVLAFLMGMILLSSLVAALAPPLKYDALMYHLVMPQTYIQQGRITHIPWLVMTGMPQCTEMLYTLAALWGGLPAAAVTGWLAGVLAILGIIGFFQVGFEKGSRIGWTAAASLLAGETFAASLSWAYIDWTGLFFGVCCLSCLHFWFSKNNSHMAIWAGLFAGLAFTTKYTGGILALCSLTAVGFHLFQQARAGSCSVVKPLLLFIGGLLAFPLVWLARNIVLTGSPIYPFFFPAAQMDAVRLSVYQGAVPYGEWWEGFLLPFRATLWGQESAEGYSVSIGPLLLLLSLGNLLRCRKLNNTESAALQLGLVFFFSAWLFWAVGNRLSGYLIQTRMYFSLFPAFTVLAGLGWDAVEDINWMNIRFSRVFGAVILLALGLSTLNLVFQTIKQDALRVDAGLISEEAYNDANLGWYAPAVRAGRDLPAGSKTLFLYEPRGLACIPACDPDEILDHWKISRLGNETVEDVFNHWKQNGYNYLFVNQAGIQFLSDGNDAHHPVEELQALKNLLSQIPVMQSFGDSYQLYGIP